ncbi:MAG: hypothetical protein QXM86_01585 [Candidatus Bathyarchaeia archaeon]
MDKRESHDIARFRNRLENAKGYGEIWEIVKDCAEFHMQKRRGGMMLFLDDLPIQLGAYHSLGTNNIVLNRRLVQIVEATIKSKPVVNALIYNLLLHEYLHALGEFSEVDVRQLVYEISRKCFGEDHVTTAIAKKSPWALLKDIPPQALNLRSRVVEIVRDFEKTDKYIV